MRRFNCCVFNHPCPIFCRALNRCENEVVNPVLEGDFGFFNNLSVGSVADNAIIPLNFVQGGGMSITSASGEISLLAGSYQITYLAGGNIPASGNFCIKLRLNGTDLTDSILVTTGTAGNRVNLTQTIVLTLPQTGTLELVNNSGSTTIYAYANLFASKI